MASGPPAAVTSIGSRECDESLHLARGPIFEFHARSIGPYLRDGRSRSVEIREHSRKATVVALPPSRWLRPEMLPPFDHAGRRRQRLERFRFGSDAAFAPREELLDGVTVAPLSRSIFQGSSFQAAVFRIAPGRRIARHPATYPQVLAVLDGSGNVSGPAASTNRSRRVKQFSRRPAKSMRRSRQKG